MSEKHLFIHLDRMVVGAFANRNPVMGEDGFEKVSYIPFNTFPAKKSTTDDINSDNIFTLFPKQTGEKGIPRSVTLVYTNDEGSLMKRMLEDSQKKRADELADENKQLRIELSSTRQDLEEARSSLAKAMESVQGIGKSRQTSAFDIPPSTGFSRDGFDNFD